MDGFLRSFPRLGGALGGDESRLLLSIAELLVPDGSLSVILDGRGTGSGDLVQ
jgi:hypothetical protein